MTQTFEVHYIEVPWIFIDSYFPFDYELFVLAVSPVATTEEIYLVSRPVMKIV